MTEQEKYYLESAKQTAKAAIRCRRDLSEQQKQEALKQVDFTGYKTEAFVEFCKMLGIKL